MPKQSSFALLYKRLLDGNFEPDPGRAGQTLAALLRQLPVPPKKNGNTGGRTKRSVLY